MSVKEHALKKVSTSDMYIMILTIQENKCNTSGKQNNGTLSCCKKKNSLYACVLDNLTPNFVDDSIFWKSKNSNIFILYIYIFPWSQSSLVSLK